MALAATAIVSLDNAKTRLKLSSADHDAIVESMIENATALIEAELGRPVVARTLTGMRIDGTGEHEILIPWTPVQAVTSFEIRDDRDDTSIVTISDSSKWILKDAELGLVRLTEEIFYEGEKNVLFTGSVGFASSDLRMKTFIEACYIALDDLYRRWDRTELSLINKSYPDGQATMVPAASLPPAVRQMIAPHRKAMGIVA